MAGDKWAPEGWENMPHIQRKWIKGNLYIYQYDPTTQRETYLGAAEPVYGIIDSMSKKQQEKIGDMFNRGDSVWAIIDYVKSITGYRLTKQSVYGWIRGH